MYTLFVIFIMIAALLMIGIRLIQVQKAAVLHLTTPSSIRLDGVRKTTDFIEKTTLGVLLLQWFC